AVALIGGVVGGLYYPAYPALLPTVLPADQLLAAYGFVGMTRPVLMQAGGPALASALTATSSPGAALVVPALTGVVALACILRLPQRPVERSEPAGGNPAVALLGDVREGFGYMIKTPWLLGTLVFASLLIFVMMGPFEVLVPFAIKDNAGGGPQQHAFVLAAFGIGGAVGSLAIASFRLPKRYLTVMNLLWAGGCLPLVIF